MTVQTTAERAVDVLAEARESIAPAAERVADVIEETADRIASDRSKSGRRFHWRPLLVTVGVVTAGLAVAKALRVARSRHGLSSDASDFPSDWPEGTAADDAQAKVDKSVAEAKEVVTDLTERARKTASDAL